MRTLVTGKQMKAIDSYTIHQVGIPSLVLMERAALETARAAERMWNGKETIWAVCGTGNNGADGVAAARMLHLKGCPVRIFLVGNPEKGTEEFRTQLRIAGNTGLTAASWQDGEEEECGLLIDAIFGVGLGRLVEGEYRQCMEMLASKAIRARVALDIPSGVHADTGQIMGIALPADVTVTFGWEKMGTALYPGKGYAGAVQVADIGFPVQALEILEGEEPYALSYGEEDLGQIPQRPAYSNKGTFGKVLVVAGCADMCGAAYLAALSAYRAGAGLVKILTVEENRQALKERLPEAILCCYRAEEAYGEEDTFREQIEAQVKWADVIVLGPGLGQEPYVEELTEHVLTSAFVPVVIDADGLNTIAAHPRLSSYYTENIIVTPHLGEMARLTGKTVKEIQKDLPGTAREYAQTYGITCVLKDAASVVAGKDGSLYVNASGTSAMAKGGAGDVLTGLIAGLLAIGMDQEEAACMGVYVHGRAGEKAAQSRGDHSLLASELADALGEAMRAGDHESRRN